MTRRLATSVALAVVTACATPREPADSMRTVSVVGGADFVQDVRSQDVLIVADAPVIVVGPLGDLWRDELTFRAVVAALARARAGARVIFVLPPRGDDPLHALGLLPQYRIVEDGARHVLEGLPLAEKLDAPRDAYRVPFGRGSLVLCVGLFEGAASREFTALVAGAPRTMPAEGESASLADDGAAMYDPDAVLPRYRALAARHVSGFLDAPTPVR